MISVSCRIRTYYRHVINDVTLTDLHAFARRGPLCCSILLTSNRNFTKLCLVSLLGAVVESVTSSDYDNVTVFLACVTASYLLP